MLLSTEKIKLFFEKFYIFSGILPVKNKNDCLVPSKFQSIFNIVKYILVVIYQTLYFSSSKFRSLIFIEQVVNLTQFSGFSYALLTAAIISYQCSTFLAVLHQNIRYKKIASFINKIQNCDDLLKPSLKKFKNYFIKNFVILFICLYGWILPSCFSFLTLDKKLGILLHLLFTYYALPALAFIHFIDTFKEFLILHMKQILDDLKNSKFDEKTILKSLSKMRKFSKILEEFHETFGKQITILSSDCAVMVTLMVIAK